jgi:hypothetical protein
MSIPKSHGEDFQVPVATDAWAVRGPATCSSQRSLSVPVSGDAPGQATPYAQAEKTADYRSLSRAPGFSVVRRDNTTKRIQAFAGARPRRPCGRLRQNTRPVETHGTVRIGRSWFHEPPNAGAGHATLRPPGHSPCAGWGLPGQPPLDTHGGSWISLYALGRPPSDLLPARLAFVTRDLAVLVVSTGASRRHRLSLIEAVRGRTLRWFRHGSLPCYARV